MLEKTKGTFRIIGIVRGKDIPKNGNGYNEGTFRDTKGVTRKYRSIRFLVQTAPDNMIPVELFGGERDTAIWYNRKTKHTKKVAWQIRHNKPDEGYSLIVPDYDLVQTINESCHDGDSVVIVGEPRFSIYFTPDGRSIPQTRYIIKRFFKATSEVDFNVDNFKEINGFIQEVVIDELEVEKETDGNKEVNRLNVHVYVVDNAGKVVPTTMVINPLKDQVFAKNMMGLKFGDKIRVNGIIHNRQIIENITENDGWGTKERVATRIYKALEITGANPETLERGKYTLEDLTGNNNTVEQESQDTSWLFEEQNLPF